jgi:hypothetical protein
LVKDGHTPVDPLSVRDHSCRFFVISVTYESSLAQVFLALLGLGTQNVTQIRLVPFDLSRPGLLEALGSAFVCFQFWHNSSQLSIQISAKPFPPNWRTKPSAQAIAPRDFPDD